MRRSQHAECVFPWRSTGSHGRDIGKQNRAKEEDREQPTTIHAKYPGCVQGLNQLYVLLQEKARARAMSGLGEAAADQGDIDSAARYLGESIELDRTLGDTASMASTLGNLGWALRRRGEHQGAIALLEEAGGLFREVGETPHLPHVLCELAAALADQGEVARALSLYRECGMLLWDMGDKTLLPGWFEGIVMLAGRQGQAARAARLSGAARSALTVAERGDMEESVRRIRREVGEETWRCAWESGQAMSLEQAMAYALAGGYE